MVNKIVLTLLALVLAISTLFYVNLNKTINITVDVEIVYEEEVKTISLFIPDDSSFIIELSKVYELDIKDGFLYKIDFLECSDNSNAYIAIYVNDSYSRYGISSLKLNDNDKVSFIYTLL